MRNFIKTTLLATLVAGHAIAPCALAQSSGGPYVIDRVVIAGGGGPLSGGPYQMSGTFGQPATTKLSAQAYAVFGGFWTPAAIGTTDDRIFANGFDPGF